MTNENQIENVEFFRKKLITPIQATDFRLSNHLTDYHSQDCCENVYADFDVWDAYKAQIENLGIITEVSISGTPEMGFTVFLYNNDIRLGIFTPCHNAQNGYYSTNLDLNVTFDGVTETFDISQYEEDEYN